MKNDVLICRTNGNPNLVGKSALVAKDYPFAYESHLFKVRANRELINSATLCIYLNTKYGKFEIERLLMQGNQANFSLAKFKEIRIPKLSYSLCN
jgi:restriction endonuclease S subunit